MSDSIKLRRRSLVVGTAGHIDHGKTSLVRVLTGVDTDRLAEEKRRGISIDLGFAHCKLAGGSTISFVDVPGHENFIRNMLAGASGISAVMLIVAADEGVKPQTREHFDICRLLGVELGLVALTKIDVATLEQRERTLGQLDELCAGSFLEGSVRLAVSARTGAGLDELRNGLETLAQVAVVRDGQGFARLPIDRSFALKGFGTVVTGTLASGELKTGDAVVLHPEGLECRIRGLQVHGHSVALARAGERTAVNLSGIEHSQASRGMVLTHVNQLAPTHFVDVALSWLSGQQRPQRRQQYLLHAGTAEIPVALKAMGDGDQARIWLTQPALLLPEDRFVLRRPSPAQTVAGGKVLDPFPPARLNRQKLAERISSLQGSGWPERLELLVEESANGRRLSDLVRRTGLTTERLLEAIAANPKLKLLELAGRVVSTEWVTQTRQTLLAWLAEFHRLHPELPGAPISQARQQIDPALAKSIVAGFAPVTVNGDIIALAKHKPLANAEQTRALSRVEEAFRQAGYQPPAPAEVLKQLGTDFAKGRPLLDALVRTQRLVRIADDLLMHSDVVRHIQVSLAAHKGLRFSVPEFKEWTQVSRKYAIPLLEYLDRQRITRRDGDARIVL